MSTINESKTITNDTIKCQLSHRTIRKFTDQPVSEEILQTLFDVAIQTATSMGMQNTSIIWVKDQAKRERLAEINKQDYVAQAPVYLMFVADLRRASRIFQEAGKSDEGVRTMDLFTSAFTDACLQVQNLVVAAESLGLGTTILGGILNDPVGVIETLELPELTFPVLAVILGYPNQEPMMKPRMPKELRVMVDSYHEPENITQALKPYDQQMQTYYDLRQAHRPEAAYTQQVMAFFAQPRPARARIVHDIAHQGFTV